MADIRDVDVVMIDVRCAKCGYSLRTLREDGDCPECGYPVARSTVSTSVQEVRDREERVLSKSQVAERWRRCATVLSVLFLLLAALSLVLIRFPLLPEWLMAGDTRSTYVAMILGTLVVGGLLAGLLMILLRAWLGVWCEHAAFLKACRKSDAGIRSDRSRKRDTRIARRRSRYESAAMVLKMLYWLAISYAVLVTLSGIGVILLTGRIKAMDMIGTVIVQAIVLVAFIMLGYWIADARRLHAMSIQGHRTAAM